MRAAAAGLLLAGAVMWHGPALAEVDEPTATRLMRETVLWEAVSAVSAGMLDGVENLLGSSRNAIPAASARPVLQIAESVLAPENAQDSALRVMRQGLDAGIVAELRKWNATPLGQRLLSLEKSNARGTYFAWMRGGGSAALRSTDEARRQVLAEIIEAGRLAEAMVEVSAATTVLAVRGALAARPDLGQDGKVEEQLRTVVQAELAAAGQMQSSLLPVYADTYAGYSTEELRQYAAHLRSPAGAKWSELSVAAVRAVVNEATGDFLRRLAEMTAPPADAAR